MGNLLGFDATQVEITKEFTPLPNGDYEAMIVNSEFVPTKSGDGQMLKLEWCIISPPEYENRRLFDRLNLQNPNEVAVRIAQETLAKICLAINTPTINDSSELHDKPMLIRVVVTPPKGEYDAGNAIKKYMPLSSGEAGAVQASAQPKQKKEMPWKKG